MPTYRLEAGDKGRIIAKYNSYMRRILYNKPFPVAEEDMPAFIESLADPKLKECVAYLQENDVAVYPSSHTYVLLSKPKADDPDYLLVFKESEFIERDITMDSYHPRADELYAWAKWQMGHAEQIYTCMLYLEQLIKHCTTIGQVKRMLPEEMLRFIPTVYRHSLREAERQSRIPASFKYDKEKVDAVSNLVTVGSICPEEHTGYYVEVTERSS